MRVFREYATAEKATWGTGPWQAEPDKVQGVDEATDLDVLLVRSPSGAWCGYVGVTEGHPFFGKDYGQCALATPCEDTWCEHSPGARVSVHGGLTFADFCHEPTPKAWDAWRAGVIARRSEAVRYPNGDMARLLRERGHLIDDYAAWADFRTAAGICHVAGAGRPARVWWLGFDCAHSGDLTPSYQSFIDLSMRGDVYRDREYVTQEVAALARQLATVGTGGAA